MKYTYPAIFVKCEEGYAVCFPDLSGANSQGSTLIEAMIMAKTALREWIGYLSDKGLDIPSATPIKDITIHNQSSFATLISANV